MRLPWISSCGIGVTLSEGNMTIGRGHEQSDRNAREGEAVMADNTNNAQANQQPPEPSPDLKNFGERLVGTWDMFGRCT